MYMHQCYSIKQIINYTVFIWLNTAAFINLYNYNWFKKLMQQLFKTDHYTYIIIYNYSMLKDKFIPIILKLVV